MRSGLSQEPDALAVQGTVAHTEVRKSLIPWTKIGVPSKIEFPPYSIEGEKQSKNRVALFTVRVRAIILGFAYLHCSQKSIPSRNQKKI